MGAFKNLPNMHVNIGFYTSEPPGTFRNNESDIETYKRIDDW